MRRLDTTDLRLWGSLGINAVPPVCPPGVFEGEGSLSLPIAVPGEQAQISDLIVAPKTHPNPESLLGLQPAKDTCRVDR